MSAFFGIIYELERSNDWETIIRTAYRYIAETHAVGRYLQT
jgi:hypothetical protein